MQIYHEDGHIEYWAPVYINNDFINQRITFEFFLQSPQKIIDAIKFIGDDVMINDGVYSPLLPKQLKVQQQTDAEILAEVIQDEMDAKFEREGHVISQQGKKTIERFHHHAPTKKWKTNSRVKGAAL